ncbi:hypothetical protein Mh1950_06240 [Mannheimia haemolytica]
MNFGLTLVHQKNSSKRCENGVRFRANLLQPLKLYPPSQEGSFFELLTHRENDMRSCGMDPVLGESDKLKVNLCMEKKDGI